MVASINTTSANTSNSQVHEIARQLDRQFFRLMLSLEHAVKPDATLDKIGQFLEALPLATEEYDLVMARVKNARRYLESGETGAAKFEIRLLLGGLRDVLTLEAPPVVASGVTPAWMGAGIPIHVESSAINVS